MTGVTMRTTRFFHAAYGLGLSALLLTGCGALFGGGTGGYKRGVPQDETSLMKLSQTDMRANFPTGKRKFEDGYYEKDGKLKETFGATLDFHRTWISHSRGVRFNEQDYDSWFKTVDPNADEAIVIIDDFVYVLSGFSDIDDPSFTIRQVLTRGNPDRIRGLSLEEHKKQILTYLAARTNPWVKATKEAEYAASRKRQREEIKARERSEEPYQRAMTVKSFTFSAGASGPKARIGIRIYAVLEDGSELTIHQHDLAFDELFDYQLVRTDKHFSIDMQYLSGSKPEAHKITPFSFDEPNEFICVGEAGLKGSDTDARGRQLYRGYAGGDGPEISVEITNDGDNKTADGMQILRYKFTCGDRSETFTTKADSEMRVASVGGDGGYGILGPQFEGSGGGDGGNGGKVKINIASSVKSYNISCESSGGAGGAASDPKQTVGQHGVPGTKGLRGECVKIRD